MFSYLEHVSLSSYFGCLFVCEFFFCILSWSIMTPSLSSVSLYSGHLVRSSGSLLDHLNICSRNIPFVGYMGTPIVIESWLLLTHSYIWSTLKLSDCEERLWPQCMSCCSGCWLKEAEFVSTGSGVCQYLPLNMLLMKLIGSCSDIVWSWPLGVLVLGPLVRDCGANQCQMVTSPA